MGTALRYTHAVPELEKKGAAYGIESARVNGMDVLEVMTSTRKALDYIKTTGRPFFLVCDTYRFRAHSMFDAELYREKREVDAWKKKDPIPALQRQLLDYELATEDDFSELAEKVEIEVQKAVDFAEAGTWESVDDLTKYVYSE